MIIFALMAFVIFFACIYGCIYISQKKSQANLLNQLQSLIDDSTDRLQDRLLEQINTQLTQLSMTQGQKQTIEIIRQMQEQRDKLFSLLQDNAQKSREEQMKFFKDNMSTHIQYLNTSMQKLTDMTDKRLKEINERVADKLASGFEKTSKVFADIMKRLALIDNAQQKIEALSENVVSLQSLLDNKSARGAFGEVQLNTLLANALPGAHYDLQHILSNQKRADCLLKLPEPMGDIVIDSKFPLENYQRYIDAKAQSADATVALNAFKKDIKKHIGDIASKYIIANETADSAIMFIPSEAVFAKIHADLPDVVQESHKSRVWLASPTTMMAILTTVKAVIKDGATRQQVHLIQKHLGVLAKDFSRFSKRMEGLKRHISQAKDDVDNVDISAQKITKHFSKIESVELDGLDEIDEVDSIGDSVSGSAMDSVAKEELGLVEDSE